jgi:hypothetical protein
MITLDTATQTALAARAIVVRDFIWLIVKDRSTGLPVTKGYWSDVGAVSAQILNPVTGLIETRAFDGAGSLIEVGSIMRVANLTIQSVNVVLSQVANSGDLVRVYDARQGNIEIYRGLFEPAAMVQIAPAYSRFIGRIDVAEITTPAEGDTGAISLTCTSTSQELTHTNTETKSDASLRLRAAGDAFRADAAVVGTWQINWGG